MKRGRLDLFAWISSNVEAPQDDSDDAVRVSRCLPRSFERYVKIFHPVYEDLSITDKTISWDEWEQNKREHRLLEPTNPTDATVVDATVVRGTPQEGYPSRRVRWLELAHRYELQMHAELNAESFTERFPRRSWPRHLVGPEEGTLDEQSLNRLTSILTPFCGEQPCCYYFSLIATTSWKSDLLYEGALSEAPSTLKMKDVERSPTYWWPEDHSWCVHTDPDLPFSLVAGPRPLIEAVLSDDLLECIEVLPSSRLDYAADSINA